MMLRIGRRGDTSPRSGCCKLPGSGMGGRPIALVTNTYDYSTVCPGTGGVPGPEQRADRPGDRRRDRRDGELHLRQGEPTGDGWGNERDVGAGIRVRRV